jgi:hypothetical protein
MDNAAAHGRPTYGFTPEAIENIRRRYEDTDETQRSIATEFSVHTRTLDRLAQAQGWRLRKDRPLRDVPQALKIELAATEGLANPARPDAPKDDGAAVIDKVEIPAAPVAASLADRLEAAVEKELRNVEGLRSAFGKPAHRSTHAERISRTLATLTETLFKVRRLREPGSVTATNDDDLPGDADEFRVNLARRIEAFVRSRADGSVSDASEPAIGPPAAS